MNQHLYEGSLIACLKCFKKQSDPIHLQFRPNQNIISDTKEYSAPPVLYNGSNKPISPTCQGHKCPKCNKTWEHNYDCGGQKSNGLCLNCAQQNAAEINRPKHIEEIRVASECKHLTGKEAIELSLQHEEFIVLEKIKDKEGIVRPDWQDRVAEHIRMLEVNIERLRIEISSATRAKARQEVHDLNKLTPEEQEQYRRDAGKLKKAKEVKEKKEVSASGNRRENNIRKLLKLLGKEDNLSNRKLVEEITGD